MNRKMVIHIIRIVFLAWMILTVFSTLATQMNCRGRPQAERTQAQRPAKQREGSGLVCKLTHYQKDETSRARGSHGSPQTHKCRDPVLHVPWSGINFVFDGK
jgi:hypothetical protein